MINTQAMMHREGIGVPGDINVDTLALIKGYLKKLLPT